jgi:hypothetical protein
VVTATESRDFPRCSDRRVWYTSARQAVMGPTTERVMFYLLGRCVPRNPDSIHDLTIGSYYEDCFFHPCICIGTAPEHGSIYGISLVNGTFPRSCDIDHCGVRLLSFEEAMIWKFYGPRDLPPHVVFDEASKWWVEHRKFARDYWPDPDLDDPAAG